MRKNFLISSHTEGFYTFEKQSILLNLVKNLKKIFPDCFIAIASNSDVDYQTQKYADIVVIDKSTLDVPHGQGELALLKETIVLMKKHNCQDCFKMCYDFLIDETNFTIFDQWLSHNKKFVSCYWRSNGLGIGTWIWYSTFDILDQLLDYDNLNTLFEWKMLEQIREKNLINDCHLYEDHESLFNGDWSKCDLILAGGKSLKYQYGRTVAVLEMKDDPVKEFLSLQSILNQTRLPNHLLLIDRRKQKNDIRQNLEFREFFDQLSLKQISWNLIFYHNDLITFKHLVDLGLEWCWIINNGKYLDKDTLKNLNQTIISNSTVGYIKDKQNNIFFRNKVLSETNFEHLNDFIIDSFQKTSYNNLS